MEKAEASSAVNAWLDKIARRPRINLLDVRDDMVTPILSQKASLGMKKSPELSKELKEVRGSVQKEFEKSPRTAATEGICYLVYHEGRNNAIQPLYVGMAQTVGKSGLLSALFRSGGWLRFADGFGSGGHIGNLNDCFAGKSQGYENWREALFCNGPKPKLRRPVFVDIEAWTSASKSIWSEIGHIPLFLEEAIRIWLLQLAGYGDQLLNREGNRIHK